ncbi:MAG TPA: shikimate dehydrogenase [Thermoanaerobacterales bacterium]|nr:shikimate dehydrogenase [Thermoanaerobacterales bacterium]
MYNVLGTTKLFGIIGWPIEQSLSPIIHNGAFKYLDLDCLYVPFPVKPDLLDQSILGLKALSIKGVNVTIPHKEKIVDKLDELSAEAAHIGAVNTINNEEGKLKGYNTDGEGFLRAIENAGVDLDNKVIIIGAGGAARAIGIHLVTKGVKEIFICNRTLNNAEKLKDDINKICPATCKIVPFETKCIRDIIGKNDLIVNTTSLGMAPNIEESPIMTEDIFRNDIHVCDIVYNPLETLFLKNARKKGSNIIYGYEMLLYQGAAAFEIWTGKKAPVEIMRRLLESYLL